MYKRQASATRRLIDFVFVSRVGFTETADRTAPFPVVFGRHFVNSYGHIFNRIFGFTLCMYTDHTLPSDSIMTVDACDRRLSLILQEMVTSRPKA